LFEFGFLCLISHLFAFPFLFGLLFKVVLVGESAGGNLASMAIALLYNPHLMDTFSKFAASAEQGTNNDNGDVASWVYPEVTGFCCWYGVMDRAAWQGPGGKWLGWEQGRGSLLKQGLAWCFSM
jgi:hypothetical protein